MKRISDIVRVACCGTALCLLLKSAYGYMPITHGDITLKAWQRFTEEKEPAILFRLGLFDPNTDLSTSYQDMLAPEQTQVMRRTVPTLESDMWTTLAPGAYSQSPRGRLVAGAIREDDNPQESKGNPDVDPWIGSQFDREFNHFFDPAHNRPLTFPVGDSVTPIDEYYHRGTHESEDHTIAPNWALGVDDAFSGIYTRGSRELNHFTLYDAREALWRALTATRYSDGASLLSGADSTPVQSEELRRAYWATFFRSLGNVMHLLEDMAQPQHTRDEAHAGVFLLSTFTGEASFYEKYVGARTGENVISEFFGEDGESIPLQPLHYSVPQADGSTWTYPIPEFAHYEDFWSTAVGSVNPGGRGLADFSNHEFFTNKYNLLEGNKFLFPTHDPAAYTHLVEHDTLNNGKPVVVDSLSRAVNDFYTAVPNPKPVKQTVRGIFFRQAIGSYKLTKDVYDDMADQLLPRAVAYSAGLLAHFFRGQLEIGLPRVGLYSVIDHAEQYGEGITTDPGSTTTGFKKIRVRVKNVSERPADVMDGGTLTAVLRFRRNLAYVDTLLGEPNAPDAALVDDVNRSLNEEVAVSTSAYKVTYNSDGTASLSDPITKQATVTLQRNEDQEFEFHFGGKAESIVLPLNAADVYLQIIYRGRLGGDADPDAVVVATKDISEPTYINVYNGSEYVQLNHLVYTRDQVANDQALLAQMNPDCVLGAAGALQLRSNCYIPSKMNGSIDTRGSTGSNPFISFQGVEPGMFSQFAVLADSALKQRDGSIERADVSTWDNLAFDAGPCEFGAPPAYWTSTKNGVEYYAIGDGPSYENVGQDRDNTPTLRKMRGVLGMSFVSCIWQADSLPAALDNRTDVMVESLQTPYPKSVQIAW